MSYNPCWYCRYDNGYQTLGAGSCLAKFCKVITQRIWGLFFLRTFRLPSSIPVFASRNCIQKASKSLLIVWNSVCHLVRLAFYTSNQETLGCITQLFQRHKTFQQPALAQIQGKSFSFMRTSPLSAPLMCFSVCRRVRCVNCNPFAILSNGQSIIPNQEDEYKRWIKIPKVDSPAVRQIVFS